MTHPLDDPFGGTENTTWGSFRGDRVFTVITIVFYVYFPPVPNFNFPFTTHPALTICFAIPCSLSIPNGQEAPVSAHPHWVFLFWRGYTPETLCRTWHKFWSGVTPGAK